MGIDAYLVEFHTGVSVSGSFSTHDVGTTIYVSENRVLGFEREMGCSRADDAARFELFINWTLGNVFDINGWWDNTEKTTGSLSWEGFVSVSRTPSNSLCLYKAAETSSFYKLINNTAAAVGDPTTIAGEIFFLNSCIAPNTSGGNRSKKRHSFQAIHHGLTSDETQTLFNAVQLMRHDLGGGWR